MKAYLINPKHQTVDEVEYDGDYKSIYAYIGDARAFDVATLYENRDCAFVDDEGLYVEDQLFWLHRNYLQPLAGPALVLGTDEEGESIEPKTKIEKLRKDVQFLGDRFEMAMYFKVYGENPDWVKIFFENEKGAA